jgi:uncharacterized membrane protein
MDDAKSEAGQADAAGSEAVRADKPARSSADTVRSIRSGIASAVWLLAVVAALILAAGALVVALDLNPENAVVSFLTETADKLNVLGDLKTFEGGRSADSQHSALVKTVLVNWGIAALAYLIVGKVLDRLIRP